jgi:hypothetical protein
MVLFSDLPTNLGNRSSRFPHSHRHDYDGIIPKTSRLRDTHSEGKVNQSTFRVEMPSGDVIEILGSNISKIENPGHPVKTSVLAEIA